MIRNRIFLKSLAVFFVVEILVSTVLPTVSWALTAGPTAPEFSSFEPVDTTDMVNLATGEFVYNTPVLEVPGPEGGYPLSLSYHAGIKVDQEASWVGLGWTLNPGAINRSVNGFADDNVQSKRDVRDYWGGGSQTTKTYGLGLSIPKTGIGASYSLAKTKDTFKGFSTSRNANASVDPVNTALGIVASAKADQLSKNTNSLNTYNGLKTLGAGFSMEVSLDSKGVKTNMSLMGNVQGSRNNSAGNMSSFSITKDIGTFPIGMMGSFSMKEFYTRYWSDETQSLLTYGSLYPGMGNQKIQGDFYSNREFMSYAFDSYDIYDDAPNEPSEAGKIVNDVNDPTKQLGGSLPAFDRYDVLGQGVGGVMQPHIFENGDMYGQNYYERNPLGQPALLYPILGHKSLRQFSNKKVDFRFLNDFSNALTINTPGLNTSGPGLSVNLHTISSTAEGFNNNETNQKLAGSKHIEWFTNEEIVGGQAQTAGFMDCYEVKSDRKLEFDIYEDYLQPEASLPYTGVLTYGKGHGSFKNDTYDGTDPYEDILSPQFRSLKSKKIDLKKKIGGFMITNETGMTYHYAQPVYNYNEYTKSKLKKPRKGVPTFREYKNDDPYAYTWLLTAITGPDYVDRNNNNILDNEDWGYWVKFDYGRWADSYQWRTPHTGYTNDIEDAYQTFSYGIKELYYLDAIETRTHKAIFIKSKRKDGKGVTSRLEGGSNPRRFHMDYKNLGNLEFKVAPVSTMKLDAIYLFDKKELVNIPVTKSRGDLYNEATTSNPHAYPYQGSPYTYTIPYSNPARTVTIASGEDFVNVKYHNGDLVYDNDDIHDLDQFRQKALRIIEFQTDYSLAKGVPNSIGFFSDFYATAQGQPCINIGPACNEIDTRIGNNFEWPKSFGPGVCRTVPLGNLPVCCESNEGLYSYESVFKNYTNGGSCSSAENKYAGNAIQYHLTGKLTLNKVEFLGKGGANLIPATTFAYGKNPNYKKDKYDNWGYYKSDYPDHGTPIGGSFEPVDPNTSREITETSGNNSDAWSLSSIISPIGAKIEVGYENNQYYTSVYNDFSVFSIEKLEPGANPDEVIITFKEKGIDLNKWFGNWHPLFNTLQAKAFIIQAVPETNGFNDATFPGNILDELLSIGQNSITIKSPGLRNAITPKTTTTIDPLNGGTITWTSVQYFVSGFVKINDTRTNHPNPRYSGGVRVQSLSIRDNFSGVNSTVYEYKNPATGNSSGITSFTPFTQPSVQYPLDALFFDNILQDESNKAKRKQLQKYQIDFQNVVDEPFKKLLSSIKEAPAPGSIYEWVKVTNFTNDKKLDNFTLHHFKVFDENMIEREVQNSSDAELDTRTVTIKNNTIDVGSILSVKTYNTENLPLKSIEYNYLYDDSDQPFELNTIASKQGVVEQSFHKSFTVREYKVDLNWNTLGETIFGGGEPPEIDIIYKKDKAVITKRQDRSNAVTGIRETDYSKGLVTETQNHAFDFYTGQPTQIFSKDAYGNKYLSSAVPAYRKYPGMGLKIFNVHNSHMLTQVATQESFSLNESNQPKSLVSATVQTWSDQTKVYGGAPENKQPGIWRKEAFYSWKGDDVTALNEDGLYPYSNFQPFEFGANPNNSTQWQKNSETTLYNVYSNSLEAIDINNHHAATKMSSDHAQVLATASNSEYHEFAYSGAEDNLNSDLAFGGGMEIKDGEFVTNLADDNHITHTGRKALKLTNANTKTFLYSFTTRADRAYQASVWMNSSTGRLRYSINNVVGQASGLPTANKQAGTWYLVTIDIPKLTNEAVLKVWCEVDNGVCTFDDFRVYPFDASMTSYVYNEWGELSHILDNNNLFTRYIYDGMGRLKETRKETFQHEVVKTSEVKYHYSRPIDN